MSKYTIIQIAKSLDKLFSAGFKTDKSILALQLEDLEKLPEVSIQDIGIIVCYKKAIKNKKITEFLAEDDSVGGFWLVGGYYDFGSYNFPLADLAYCNNYCSDNCSNSVGWFVLSK